MESEEAVSFLCLFLRLRLSTGPHRRAESAVLLQLHQTAIPLSDCIQVPRQQGPCNDASRRFLTLRDALRRPATPRNVLRRPAMPRDAPRRERHVLYCRHVAIACAAQNFEAKRWRRSTTERCRPFLSGNSTVV